MRISAFSGFAFGFAAGILTLAAVEWGSGHLQPRITLAVDAAAAGPGVVETVRSSPPPAVAPSVPAPVDLDRQGTLGMPIAGLAPEKLTSNFSEMHNGHVHEALDLMAPRGTPVRAVDEGNVVKLFTSKDGGLTVYQFNDARELCYYYAHLDRYAAGLKEGTLLRRGDVLGYVGSTGNASPTAPHLHFAIFRLGPQRQWWKGTAIDPLPLLRGVAP
jgi:murein DD-endopeptidase MepM/ murein hydrolase activator NlpD